MSGTQASDPALEPLPPPASPVAPEATVPPPRAPTARERLMRWVPLIYAVGFVAAVGLVGVMAVRATRDLDPDELTWWPLPLAFGATLLWWLLLARGWSLLKTGTTSRADISTWCKTQSLRYLPGSIWAPVSRVAVVRGSWLDRLATVAAENLIALCAALALGGLALGLSGKLTWLALVPLIAVPALASRLLGDRTRLDRGRTQDATVNYAVGFVAYALAAVFVQIAVSGVQEPLAVAGAAVLAWSAGLAVVIAPGGIGIREVVYVGLVSPALPTAELVTAAVVMRVVAVAVELIVLVMAGRPARRAAAPQRDA